MADYTEAETTLLAHQEHTHAITDVFAKGAEYDVRSYLSATLYVCHANIEVTANATGVKYILQGRPLGSGAGDNDIGWADLVTFQTGETAAAKADITGAEAAAQTEIEVDADPTAAFLNGIDIYIHDAGAVADGEWAKCDHSVTGANHYVYLLDGLTNAKDASDEIWTQAELFSALVDLDGIAYVRLIMAHTAATGSDIVFKGTLRVATDVE
jgi:hypothetical protein